MCAFVLIKCAEHAGVKSKDGELLFSFVLYLSRELPDADTAGFYIFIAVIIFTARSLKFNFRVNRREIIESGEDFG